MNKNAAGSQVVGSSAGARRCAPRTLLLACGIAAPLLWVGADVVASLRYTGYSYADHSVSELSAIGAGAGAFGKGWRLYSYATILAMLAFGAWAAMDAPLVDANLPTPWLGLRERVNVYSFMLWLLALAIVLLRGRDGARAPNRSAG